MKVLFLDFDGVLNNTRIYAEQRMLLHNSRHGKWVGLIGAEHVSIVDRVCREADAVIVVSSSWQYAIPLEQIRLILKSKGMTVPVIDTTVGQAGQEVEGGHIVIAQERGKEIAGWLKRHPQVTHYAILDDMPEMGAYVGHKLVQTYFNHGVTEDHVPVLLRLLGVRVER